MNKLFAGLFALFAVASAAALAEPSVVTGPQTVVSIDGDTIAIGAERLRIIGLDTPEIYHVEQCSTPERTWQVLMAGYAAQGRLQHLLNSRTVRIERAGLDKYKRTLAIVHVGQDDVAEILIREGLARSYVCPGGRCPARKPWC